MRFPITRLLAAAATITAVALVLSFITRHAKHGFGLYLGDIAWPVFLLGALLTVLVGLAALVETARHRPSTRSAR
jgi:hypothetical protein